MNFALKYKIEVMEHYLNGGKVEWTFEEEDVINEWDLCTEHPTWDWSRFNYRIYREEPKTKTVYEWYCVTDAGDVYMTSTLLTEDRAKEKFKGVKSYHKTGRSFEIEV